MQQGHWDDPRTRCFGMLLDGRAQPTGIRQRGGDATLLMIVNAYHDVVIFTLPAVPEGRCWKRLIDTNVPVDAELPSFDVGTKYEVTGRSLLLFVLEAQGRVARQLRQGTAAVLDVTETPVAEQMPRRP
jgi:glycogen operon protein